MSTFGERFRQLRLDKNLSQKEFIHKFNKQFYRNLTPASISMYENDKRIPEIETLQDFASFFNVLTSYLLGEINTPTLQVTKITDTVSYSSATDIGVRLRLLRQRANVGQSVVAASLGIKPSAYSSYENGNSILNVDKLIKLSQYFNVSTSYLLGEQSNETQSAKNIDESNHRFAKALFSYRLKNQAAINDLANAIGVDQETYSKYENGTLLADIVTVSRIADFYGVTLNDLFGETRISLGTYEISSFEREMLTAYLSMSGNLRKELSAHFQSALFNTETLAQVNSFEESKKESDAAIDAELERYRLELEATMLGKTSSASDGQKRNLG